MDVNNSLFRAVRDGDLKLANEIISTYGIAYSKAWSMGYVLLRISTKNKHTEITKLLLASGAKVNNNNRRKKSNDTPLHLAAISGPLEIVEMLLDKGANIHAKNEYGATALQTAVFRNKLDVVELLLNRGASVNEKKSDGSTCLHIAVQKGNLRAVELLLKHKINVNAASNSYRRDGQTPLHLAAERGNERIVELLLKNGANVDAKAKGGITPVYFAAFHGKDKVIKQLLDHGANVNAQDTMGKTLLFLAVEKGSLKMVELILKYSPDPNNKMNSNTLVKAIYGAKGKYKFIVEKLLQHGFTYDPDHKLLQTAVEKGYKQIVENCLKTSSNVETFLSNVPNKSKSLLHVAVKNKQYEITEMLIKYGANLNSLDEQSKTPIYYATENGDIKMLRLLLAKEASVTNCSGLLINAVKKEKIEMVHLLLKHKVNVKEVDATGRTALHFCGLKELDNCLNSVLCMQLIRKFIKADKKVQDTTVKSQIAKVLLAAGADVNAKSKEGETALHSACFKGYYTVVEVLFEYNAKMFADNTGALPIHLSAYSGNVDILKMLISKGADVNAKTNDGSTAVHFATHELQTEFLEYLLNHGAKIDEQEEDGSTALHIAAKNDSLDFVNLLLNYGADIDCTDNRGRTALNIATKEGNNRIVAALLEYGCDLKSQSKTSFTPFESAVMLGVNIFGDLFNHFGSEDEDDDFDYYGSDYDCFDDSDYNDYYGSDEDYYDSDPDNFDHGGYIFSSNQIAEMLQHHVIMMKAANLEVKGENLASNETSSKLCEFKTKCEQEVEKLKSEKICANTNVTFYDILSKPIGNVAIYARNPKIIEVLQGNDYKNKFPTYSGLINGKIKRGINRKNLLDRGYTFFDLLSNSLSIRLPYNCTENICSYLSDKDLRILVDASKPVK